MEGGNVYSLMASKLGTAFSPRSSELGKKVCVIRANAKVKETLFIEFIFLINLKTVAAQYARKHHISLSLLGAFTK